MPRRIRKTKVRKPRKVRRVKKNPNLITIKQSKLHMPISPRLRTTFTADIFGQYVATAGAPNLFAGPQLIEVNLNCPHLPWATANPFLGAVFPGTITTATAQPAGFLNYMGAVAGNVTGMYTYYRVLSSKIELEMYPTNGNDTMQVVIAPCKAARPFLSAYAAGQAPYSKVKMLASGSPGGKMNLVNSISCTKWFGVAPQTVLDDLPYRGTLTATPTELASWCIVVQPVDASNVLANGAVLDYRVRVTYFTQLEMGETRNLNDG